MSSYSRKRKRPFGTRYAPQRAKKTFRSARYGTYPTFKTTATPGFTRTGGFYGRYASSRYPRNSELKFFDTALGFTFDSTGEVPTSGQLTLIPQGITESTRIGRKCVIKNISIRGNISNNPLTATATSATCHLMVVMDKQCNGAAASPTDVMTSTSFGSAMRNLSNSERFVILKRWDIPLASLAGASGAYDTRTYPIKWNKMCNIPIEFSSTTGAITEIRSNNLFLLSGSSGVDDQWALAGTCRLRFSDN